MSYILDALKRAERERKLGQAPAALDEIALPGLDKVRHDRRRWLLRGGIALALIVFAIAGRYLIPSRAIAPEPPTARIPTPSSIAAVPPPAEPALPEPRVVSPEPGSDARIEGGEAISSLDDLTGDATPAGVADGAPGASESAAIDAKPRPSSALPKKAPAQKKAAPARVVGGPQPEPPSSLGAKHDITPPPAAVAEESAPAVASPADENTIVTAPAPVAQSAEVPGAAPAPPPKASETPRTNKPAASAQITAERARAERLESLRRFKEMPAAYRAEFPALTVDVHVYNVDNTRSFVIINGKRYRDNDTLAEGPRIVEIVSEGIIFDWRGEKVLYALGR